MKLLSDSKKHNLKWNTKAGTIARNFATWLALKMLRKSRRLLKWSLGRCSWCGANCGMSSTISKKGMRCSSLNRGCTAKQYDTTSEMKADAIGEFYVACQQNCPQCTDLDESDDECVICGGEVTFDLYVPIPWTTMKDIYKRMHEKRVEEMERSNG